MTWKKIVNFTKGRRKLYFAKLILFLMMTHNMLDKIWTWLGYTLLCCGYTIYHNSVVWYVTVYPKKYAHGFCFAVLCCGHTLTDFPISIKLTSLALWQSNDCPCASKATLMNMDRYFMWIHYERLHNHNKAKHNKTVCIFLGIYCSSYASGLLHCHWGDCPSAVTLKDMDKFDQYQITT